MNGRDFVEGIRDDEATALARLGSDKYLLAVTDADLTTEGVMRTVAAAAASGRETFAAWADEERDAAAATFAAAETFAAAAETERDHYERVVADLDGDVAPAGAVHEALAAATGTADRAGALVGRGLVADRTRLQVVSFFVNEADGKRADLARELRSDATDQVDAGADLLDAVCADETDWESARETARDVVTAAYDEHVDGCERLGLDPKPVC